LVLSEQKSPSNGFNRFKNINLTELDLNSMVEDLVNNI